MLTRVDIPSHNLSSTDLGTEPYQEYLTLIVYVGIASLILSPNLVPFLCLGLELG